MGKTFKELVTVGEINSILRHAFGQKTGIHRLTVLRGGLFNTSYKIILKDRTPVVLRIAPDDHKPVLRYEKGLLQREVGSLRWLAGRGLPVPGLIKSDLTRKVIPRDYAILEFKGGRNAFFMFKHLGPQERAALFAQLGEYAKKIHSFKNEEGWFGAPEPFSPCASWSEFIRLYLGLLMEDLKRHPYFSLPGHIEVPRLLDAMAPILDEIREPHLIHGDLWWRNVLIGRNDGMYRISAILDWDRSLWGDPYFEWILYGMDLDPAFWERYRAHAPSTRSHQLRQSFYKFCGCLQAALEDSIHFRKKKDSVTMLGYAVNNYNELMTLL
jgi:aminoglycoside phosphotransferase (APT) family kinase protein